MTRVGYTNSIIKPIAFFSHIYKACSTRNENDCRCKVMDKIICLQWLKICQEICPACNTVIIFTCSGFYFVVAFLIINLLKFMLIPFSVAIFWTDFVSYKFLLSLLIVAVDSFLILNWICFNELNWASMNSSVF
jgi:hypothetical protein